MRICYPWAVSMWNKTVTATINVHMLHLGSTYVVQDTITSTFTYQPITISLPLCRHARHQGNRSRPHPLVFLYIVHHLFCSLLFSFNVFVLYIFPVYTYFWPSTSHTAQIQEGSYLFMDYCVNHHEQNVLRSATSIPVSTQA